MPLRIYRHVGIDLWERSVCKLTPLVATTIRPHFNTGYSHIGKRTWNVMEKQSRSSLITALVRNPETPRRGWVWLRASLERSRTKAKLVVNEKCATVRRVRGLGNSITRTAPRVMGW